MSETEICGKVAMEKDAHNLVARFYFAFNNISDFLEFFPFNYIK